MNEPTTEGKFTGAIDGVSSEQEQIAKQIYSRYESGPNPETAKKDALAYVLNNIRYIQMTIGYTQEGPHIDVYEKDIDKQTQAVLATAEGDWQPIKSLISESELYPVAENFENEKKALDNLAASL